MFLLNIVARIENGCRNNNNIILNRSRSNGALLCRTRVKLPFNLDDVFKKKGKKNNKIPTIVKSLTGPSKQIPTVLLKYDKYYSS